VALATYEFSPFFGRVQGLIKANSDEMFGKLIGEFMRFYDKTLCNPRWGESVSFRTRPGLLGSRISTESPARNVGGRQPTQRVAGQCLVVRQPDRGQYFHLRLRIRVVACLSPVLLGHEPNLTAGCKTAVAITASGDELCAIAPLVGAYLSERNFFDNASQTCIPGSVLLLVACGEVHSVC